MKPTLQNVTVSHCCRGIRIQDTTAIYIKDCEVKDISDNGIYFAAWSIFKYYGCHNCVVDNCIVKDVGQTGLMNIGGSCNTFKNCQVQNTNGAGGAIFNTKSNITYENCTFTAVNNDKTKTPNGNTDDYSGAAFGMSVVGTTDGEANVIVRNSSFCNVNAPGVFYKTTTVQERSTRVLLEN